MLPDRVSNPGPLTYESGALPIAQRGPANLFLAHLSGTVFLWMGTSHGFGGWGEWLFIFRELGSTSNYFQVAGEQALNFRELGSTVSM